MAVKEPVDKIIITNFLRAGFNITPGALSFIKNKDDPAKFANILLHSFNNTKQRATITRQMLENIDAAISDLVKNIPSTIKPTPRPSSLLTESVEDEQKKPRPKSKSTGKDLASRVEPLPMEQQRLEAPLESQAFQAIVETFSSVESPVLANTAIEPELTSKSIFTPLAKEYSPVVKIIEDCTGRLKNDGEFSDFSHLFNDRFEKLKNMFKNRNDIARLVDISDLATMGKKSDELYIAGMVVDKKQTKSGNTILEIDDKTGRINVILSTKSMDPKNLAYIILDEVLCFKGFYKDGIFISNEFHWPDVKHGRQPHLSEDDLSILLISDLHVGSDNHLSDIWNRFRAWMRGEGTSDKAREMAGKVKYIAIAGDLVDGIGVYPTQEEHLVIKDATKQFEKAAEMLGELPDYVTFIIAPGSHEPVRRALPQPATSKSYAKSLYDMGAIMVSDPAVVETHSIKTMMFHGESFIDLSIDIPEITHKTPELSMEKLLKSRHLAPSFGKKTELAPDKRDWLVISEVPDILHTGHVHCNGVKNYHGTWLVNSGCFQGQTDFMRGLGIVPTIGQPNIISLKDFKLTTLNLTG